MLDLVIESLRAQICCVTPVSHIFNLSRGNSFRRFVNRVSAANLPSAAIFAEKKVVTLVAFAMSGIEVAALVIGLIPVILETFDRSRATTRTLRKSGPGASHCRTIDLTIKMQRIKFHRSCKLLLPEDFESGVQLDHMLHHDFPSVGTEEKYQKALTARLKASNMTIDDYHFIMDRIHTMIRELSEKLRAYESSIPQGAEVSVQCWCLLSNSV